MLEPKDLQKIGEELGKVIEQNVTPALDGLDGRMGSLEGGMSSLEKRVGHIEAEMVTKSYLDDKLADLEGGLIARLRKEDTKLNHLVDILKQKKVLTEQETKQLAEYKVFPRTS